MLEFNEIINILSPTLFKARGDSNRPNIIIVKIPAEFIFMYKDLVELTKEELIQVMANNMFKQDTRVGEIIIGGLR